MVLDGFYCSQNFNKIDAKLNSFTEEQKKIKSLQNTGLVWMNNGKRNYRIKPELVSQKQNEGLQMGYLRGNYGKQKKN